MDDTPMNLMLDAAYGVDRAAGCPSSHELALFYGDPTDGGVEVSGGGYARVTVDETDWLPAEDGAKSTVELVFPDTTDDYDTTATHWALIGTGGMWDSGPLDEPMVVTGVGAGPLVTVVVRWSDTIIPDEG